MPSTLRSGTGVDEIVDTDAGLSGVRREVVALGKVANPTASLVIVGGSYTSGDLIANSTTAASVVHPTMALVRNSGGSFNLLRMRIRCSAACTGSVRVHVFRSAPAVSTTGDNGVLATVLAGRAAERLGAIDVTFDQAWNDGSEGVGVPNAGSTIAGKLADGVSTVHLVTEARSATFPSGATFTYVGEVLQD
jgi:hypothetical protein